MVDVGHSAAVPDLILVIRSLHISVEPEVQLHVDMRAAIRRGVSADAALSLAHDGLRVFVERPVLALCFQPPPRLGRRLADQVPDAGLVVGVVDEEGVLRGGFRVVWHVRLQVDGDPLEYRHGAIRVIIAPVSFGDDGFLNDRDNYFQYILPIKQGSSCLHICS